MDLASLLLSLLTGLATAPAEPARAAPAVVVSPVPFIRPLWPPLGG